MLIQEMVEHYSPTGSESGLVDYLVTWANDHGFNSRKDKVGNFIAEKGRERELGTAIDDVQEILLVGHVDTVPGEIPVRIEGDELYGRGSVDAKGPLGCFLEAANQLDEMDLEDRRIIIVGAVEEEGESRGARSILDRYDPTYIIIGEPSGWSNLNIGYKGCLNMTYRRMKPMEHTSSSESNCNEEAIEFHLAVRQFVNLFNEGKSLFHQLGMKLISIRSGDDPFFEDVNMRINFRTPIGFDVYEFQDFLRGQCGCAEIKFSEYIEPIKAGKGGKLVSSFMKAIRKSGGDVTFKLKSGTSDMNILQKYGVPMITYGPGDSSLDHTPHEYLNLAEYKKSILILREVLQTL